VFNPTDQLPLSPLSFHILLALGEKSSHGYAIGKEVERRSHGRINPTTGALYQALRRLSEDGLVERDDAASRAATDSRRQYFRLTPRGREVAALEAARLQELVGLARARRLFPESP
jgi:DNA-binding PadR family transcriptional regulator